MRRILLTCVAGAVLAAGAIALAHPGQEQLAAPKAVFVSQSDSVPFELFRGNRLVATASINSHSTEVLLDTGAGATTLDRAFARSIGLPAGQKIEGMGAGGSVEAELVKGVSLDIGGLQLRDMTVAVMDLQPVARAIGRPINAVVGRELFNAAVVSIDWESSRMAIRSPAQFKPAGRAVAVPLERKGPFHTIPVSIAGGKTIQALLDVGNGSALTLPKGYWAAQPQIARLPFAQSQLGGVGGLHSARVVTMPQVTLAGRTFERVPTSLSDSGNNHEATEMANVGVGLLKQFHVDLDLGNDRIYLAPRNDAPPFERDRAGARFELAGDRLKTVFVTPQGPAAAAGLKAGDEIVAVDGRAVSTDYYQAADWSRAAPGRQVSLKRADGTKVEFALRDYY